MHDLIFKIVETLGETCNPAVVLASLFAYVGFRYWPIQSLPPCQSLILNREEVQGLQLAYEHRSYHPAIQNIWTEKTRWMSADQSSGIPIPQVAPITEQLLIELSGCPESDRDLSFFRRALALETLSFIPEASINRTQALFAQLESNRDQLERQSNTKELEVFRNESTILLSSIGFRDLLRTNIGIGSCQFKTLAFLSHPAPEYFQRWINVPKPLVVLHFRTEIHRHLTWCIERSKYTQISSPHDSLSLMIRPNDKNNDLDPKDAALVCLTRKQNLEAFYARELACRLAVLLWARRALENNIQLSRMPYSQLVTRSSDGILIHTSFSAGTHQSMEIVLTKDMKIRLLN